jgi:hypothetical protein
MREYEPAEGSPDTDGQPKDVVQLSKVTSFDHSVGLVEHEKPKCLGLLRQRFVLMPKHKCQTSDASSSTLTSSIRSHRRPGVATRTSTPRSNILRCFCADIPPTIAATLTGGGPFDPPTFAPVFFSAFPFPFPLPIFFLCFGSSAWPSSGSAGTTIWASFKQAFKCAETWRASSRVGARISAESWRLPVREFGRGVVSKWLRIGRP